MRTIDTTAVIKRALGQLDNYPAGSVSKREVVKDLNFAEVGIEDPEEYGRKLNGRLTKAIYDHWNKEIEKSWAKPKEFGLMKDQLTKVVQDLFGA